MKLYNIDDVKKNMESYKDSPGFVKMCQRQIDAKVGDKHVVDYSSGPFGGKETFEITRIENGDVYGKSIEGGAFELDPEDVV